MPYVCEHCHRRFRSKEGRRSHLWCVHKISGTQRISEDEYQKRLDDRRRNQRLQYQDRSRSPGVSRRRETDASERRRRSPANVGTPDRVDENKHHAPPVMEADEPNTIGCYKNKSGIPAAEGRAVTQRTETKETATQEVRQVVKNSSDPVDPAQPRQFVTMAARKDMTIREDDVNSRISDGSDLDETVVQQLVPQALELADIRAATRATPRFPAAPCKPVVMMDKKDDAAQESSDSESEAESEEDARTRGRFEYDTAGCPWQLRKLIKMATERPHVKVEKLWLRCCGGHGPNELQAREFAGQVRAIRATHRSAVRNTIELAKKAF